MNYMKYCAMEKRREMDLMHHGIDGQKWGVKHGPPYPLDSSKSTGSRLKVKKKKSRAQKKEEKRQIKRKKEEEKLNTVKKKAIAFVKDTYSDNPKLEVEKIRRLDDKKMIGRTRGEELNTYFVRIVEKDGPGDTSSNMIVKLKLNGDIAVRGGIYQTEDEAMDRYIKDVANRSYLDGFGSGTHHGL